MNSNKRGVWYKTKTMIFLSAMIALIIFGTSLVLAAHTSTVTVTPHIVPADVSADFQTKIIGFLYFEKNTKTLKFNFIFDIPDDFTQILFQVFLFFQII